MSPGRWYDRDGVELIVEVPNPAVALAVQQIAREQQSIVMTDDSGTMLLSGKQCSPTGFQRTFDTYSLAHSTGRAAAAK
jgi:branched-chain amino acid transport system substrate-binding protein